MILVFDLDGTLIDSARDLAQSIGELLTSYGAEPLPLADVVAMVGEGAPVLVRRALARAGLHPTTQTTRGGGPGLHPTTQTTRGGGPGLRPGVDEALARFLKIYDRRIMNHTIAYPGVVESLALSVRRGPLAVLTNKPLGPSIGILEGLALRGFFTRVIGGDSEYGRKPDPSGLLALQALGPGEKLVMIGDSPTDYTVAVNANCPFVFARFGFGAAKFSDGPPDTPFAIDHPRELDGVVNRLEGLRA